MKRFSIVLSVVCVLAVSAFAAAAGNGSSGKRFLGLWEGIDPLDGSSQQVSISAGADGGFSLLWSESYWTVCDGRRAVLEGGGEFAPGGRNALVFQMRITCFDPEAVPVEGARKRRGFEIERIRTRGLPVQLGIESLLDTTARCPTLA